MSIWIARCRMILTACFCMTQTIEAVDIGGEVVRFCDSLRCPGGWCVITSLTRQPECQCDTGLIFSQQLNQCVPDGTVDFCSDVVCRNGSTCVFSKGKPQCISCSPGFHLQGSQCVFVPTTTAKLISNTEALPLVFKWPEVIAPPVTPQSLKAKTASTARCNLSHCKCRAGFQFDNRARFCRVEDACNSTSKYTELGSRSSADMRVRQGVTSGCIQTENYPLPYPNNVHKELAIPIQGFSVLKVFIQDLQIQSDRKGSHFIQNRCHNDYLYISGQLMCGSLRRGQRVISVKLKHKPQVVIGFRSDKHVSFRGFRLKWQLETF